jgi:hypothetical protein
MAGADAIHAYADTNVNNAQDPGEPFGDAIKAWIPGPPTKLTLSPATATNTVDSQHCVTATVTDSFNNPISGVTVRFSVTPTLFHTPTSGSMTTNAFGQAQFCYTSALPGSDLIHAYADTNNNNAQDVGEPFGDATKIWIPPVSTLCEVNITYGGWITAANTDKGTFGGNAKATGPNSPSGQEEYQDHGPAIPSMDVHSIDVLAVTCTADFKQGSIYGTATINGSGTFVYRIDVQDNAEPGTGQDKYGIRLSNGYDSGLQILKGGNVQIHQP